MRFRLTISTLFLFISYAFLHGIAHAQTNSTPYVYRLIFGVPYNYDGKAPVYDNKHIYTVILKDSSKIEVDSKIWDDVVQHKSYILYIDKKYPKSDYEHRERKIYPNETISVSRMGVDLSDVSEVLTGIPQDSCWMFKIVPGAISAYSYLSEQNDSFNPVTIVGIQKGDGIIQKYNPKNLQDMLAGDHDALKDFDKQDYIGAIKKYNRDAKKAANK